MLLPGHELSADRVAELKPNTTGSATQGVEVVLQDLIASHEVLLEEVEGVEHAQSLHGDGDGVGSKTGFRERRRRAMALRP